MMNTTAIAALLRKRIFVAMEINCILQNPLSKTRCGDGEYYCSQHTRMLNNAMKAIGIRDMELKEIRAQDMSIVNDEELREEIGKIHGRLHGRQITHKEVAKHSKWSPEELQHVLIEDEYIFIAEIVRLFKSRDRQIILTAQQKVKSICGCPMCEFHVTAYALQPNEGGK